MKGVGTGFESGVDDEVKVSRMASGFRSAGSLSQQACGGDEALVSEVERLLARESEPKSFIEALAMEVAAK